MIDFSDIFIYYIKIWKSNQFISKENKLKLIDVKK